MDLAHVDVVEDGDGLSVRSMATTTTMRLMIPENVKQGRSASSKLQNGGYMVVIGRDGSKIVGVMSFHGG